VGAGLSLEGYFGDDDDIQRLCKRLVEQSRLGQPGLDVPLHGSLFEVLHRDVVVSHLAAIRAMRTPPGLGADVGEVQRRIASPLGHQVQGALPSDMQGMAVANMTVQYQVRQREIPGEPFEEGLEHGTNVL
jgi:hypothetical protein